MSILASLLVALIAVSGSNICLKDLNIDKTHYFADLEKAKTNQNDYCLSFLKDLELNDELSDFTNVSVLTHGLGDKHSYCDWLPEYKYGGKTYFTNKDFSLPFVLTGLADKNIDYFTDGYETSVYLFSPSENSSTPKNIILRQLCYYSNFEAFAFKQTTSYIETRDIDESNIVLLYDDKGGKDNSGLYFSVEDSTRRFELSLSNVLCQIYNAQLGNLGKINLIGHSKGGITNLLFTTRHHNLVNNLISLGTPYNGSYWADPYNSIEKITNVFDDNPNIGTMYDDLLDPNHPIEYSNLFNQRCLNVNSYALGFNMDAHSLFYSLASFLNGSKNVFDNIKSKTPYTFSYLPYIEQLQAMISNYFRAYHLGDLGFDSVDNFFNLFLEEECDEEHILTEYMARQFVEFLFPYSKNYVNNNLSQLNYYKDFLNAGSLIADSFELSKKIRKALPYAEVLFQQIRNLADKVRTNQYGNTTIINSDVCVETESQIGEDLYNFDRTDIITIQAFQDYKIYDAEHCSRPDSPLVPHNFETKNPTAIRKIVSYLDDHSALDSRYSLRNSDLKKLFKPAVFADESDNVINELFNKSNVSPGQYGFPDYYCYESDLQNNPSIGEGIINGTQIQTNRLRTGYIQKEKIVLSPDRNNAGCAFLEYELPTKAYAVEVDLSMWSNKENINLNGEILFFTSNKETMHLIKNVKLYDIFTPTVNVSLRELIYRNITEMSEASKILLMKSPNIDEKLFNDYCDALKGLQAGTQFDLKTFSTDRSQPNRYLLVFPEPSQTFGFYTAVDKITGGNNNKGRVCLGNMTIYA